MKVTAFNGSPRKDGNTFHLVNHVFEALKIEGVETERAQCVDLLVGFHAAKVCGKSGTRAAAHNDCGHDHAHFPDHGDADQIRDVEARPEAGELDVSDKRKNQSDEEADE